MKKNTLEISNSSKEKIRAVLHKIEYDRFGSDEYIHELRKAAYESLDDNVLKCLTTQLSGTDNKPYIIFKNLPHDEVNSSPLSGEAWNICKKTCLSENVIAMFGSCLGEPYSISFEGHDLVNNLVPYKENEKEYTGLGSNVELDFHIENAALQFFNLGNFSPRGLFLSAVRLGPKQRPNTRYSSGREALKILDTEILNELRKNHYILKVPFRWRNQQSIVSETTNLIPAISGSIEYPSFHVAFYSDMVLGVTDKANEALEKLYLAIRKVSEAMVIKPGEMIFIDNRFAFHSRDQFTATYDENNRAHRWLQRVFISDSLWDFRKMDHDSRIFKPDMQMVGA